VRVRAHIACCLSLLSASIIWLLKKRILMGTRKKMRIEDTEKNINGNEKKNEDRRYRKVRKIKKKLCFSLSFFALSSSTHLSCLAPFLLSSHFILFLYRSLSLNYFFAFLPVFVFISFSPYGRSNSIKKKECGFYEKCSLPLDLPTIY